MHFTGTIHGIKYSSNGTVEQIYAQFKAEHPEVAERPHCCREPGGPGWGWYPAQTYYIDDGINYLSHFHGRCDIGPGPGNCGRISCSYSSGIYLCNDNDYWISPILSIPCYLRAGYR
ncbi:hypothetical protein B0J14DRAFT_661226 [Halenospora varia]|nr:hypothetical protein B0J14DRAFT_661226 [Halenospora varia]